MNDHKLEVIIGNLLRIGVLLAAAIVFTGGVLYLAQFHGAPVNYKVFIAGGPSTRTIGGILHSARHLQSQGLMQLGLVLLIATPVARVAFAVVGFALEKDHLYAVISFIVLCILAYSIIHIT